MIGRDLTKIIFVDDLKRNAKYNPQNLFLVTKWIDNIYDNNSGEIIPDGGLHSTNVKNKAFVISRVNDFQNCYTEDFYTFRQPKKELIDNITVDNLKYTINSEGYISEIELEISVNAIPEIYYPLDKYFFIKLKADRNAFSQKDVVKFKNKEIIITNSILYYLNYFYHKQVYIKFNTRKTYLKPITIESQNYQCYLCKKKHRNYHSGTNIKYYL